MSFPNSSVVSSRYNEDGINLQGGMMPSKRSKSVRSMEIERAMETISMIDGDTDKVITAVLSKSIPCLNVYVASQNEVPEQSLEALTFQAALLRMADIATISRNLDVSDYDATCLLEQSESEIIERGLPQKKYMLPPDVQACINVVIDAIKAKDVRMGGSGKIRDIVASMKQKAKKASYFVGADTSMMLQPSYGSDYPNLNQYPTASEESSSDDVIGVAPPFVPQTSSTPEIEPMPIPVRPTGVLDFVDKAIDAIKNVKDAVSDAGNTLGDAIDNVKDKVSDIGGEIAADSIQKAILKNLPLVIGVVIALTVIIIIIARASKSKN